MDKIIDKIIKKMKISDSLTDDEEIVRYGLEIMITKMIFAVSITVVGLLMKSFFEGVVFTAAYSLIRQYGGGSHAKTRIMCYIRSMLTFIAALVIIKAVVYMPVLVVPLSVLSVISVVYIFFAAPIDSENKRLDSDEIRVLGRKTRMMAALMLLISVALLLLKFNVFAFSVMTEIFISAFLMVVGQIENYRSGEDDEY
jgi:accessory gene regulator B